MLKKSELLAGAVAAAAAVLSSGVIAADAKGAVYGDLRFGVDYSETSAPASADTDFREPNGYVGAKGSVSQGGWSAFGVFEQYADAQAIGLDTPRQTYGGVTGPMGTISFGAMFTAYAKAGLAVDPFYNTSLASATGTAAGTTGVVVGPLNLGTTYVSFGQSPLLTGDLALNPALLGASSGRFGGIQENQLAYETPSIAGLTINAGVILDEADDSSAGPTPGEAHDYALGATWGMDGLSASVQYLQINDDTGLPTFATTPGSLLAVVAGGGFETDALRVTAGYATDQMGVAASYELVDHETLGGAPVPNEEYMLLSGWFGVAPGTRLVASWGRTDDTGFSGDGIQVAVFHDVVQNLTVHAGGSFYDLHDDRITGATGTTPDAYIVAVGASYKFNLGFSATTR
jgi:hypothetical protein